MKRICVPVGCRSDAGLSAPVIKRLKEHFEVNICELIPQDFGASYQHMHDWLYWHPTDLVFITGDRVEMCAAAAAAFHSKVKIAHFYAGVVNDPITTFDDIDRHCITLWSDIQFCEDLESYLHAGLLKVAMLPRIHGERTGAENAHIVGISHLDDLEVDESKVPVEDDYSEDLCDEWEVTTPYDLLLINHEPMSSAQPIPI